MTFRPAAPRPRGPCHARIKPPWPDEPALQPHLSEVHVDWHVAAKSEAMPPTERDHAVATGGQILLGSRFIAIPARQPVLEEAAHASLPVVGAIFGPSLVICGVPLDRRVEEREECVQIPFHPRLPCAPHDLQVLPRHRVLPQPGCFEGLRVIEQDRDVHDLAVSQTEDPEGLLDDVDRAPLPPPNWLVTAKTRSPASIKLLDLPAPASPGSGPNPNRFGETLAASIRAALGQYVKAGRKVGHSCRLKLDQAGSGWAPA
jgi:hypothetical protein